VQYVVQRKAEAPLPSKPCGKDMVHEKQRRISPSLSNTSKSSAQPSRSQLLTEVETSEKLLIWS